MVDLVFDLVKCAQELAILIGIFAWLKSRFRSWLLIRHQLSFKVGRLSWRRQDGGQSTRICVTICHKLVLSNHRRWLRLLALLERRISFDWKEQLMLLIEFLIDHVLTLQQVLRCLLLQCFHKIANYAFEHSEF